MNDLEGMIMMIEELNPITNQTITVNAVECSMNPTSDKLINCAVLDEFGVQSEVQNVGFINLDARGPKFETHRDANTSEAVIYAEFDALITCEIMGQNARGLTVNCPRGTS